VLALHQPKALLADVRAIQDSTARAEVLAVLVQHVADEDRATVVQEALAAVHDIKESGV